MIAEDQYMHLPGYVLVDLSLPGSACEPEFWKEKEGLDFHRLGLVQDIHEDMKSGFLSIDEASRSLDLLMLCKPKYNVAITFVANGMTICALATMLSSSVLVNTPAIFVLGGALGLLRQNRSNSTISYNTLQIFGAATIPLFQFSVSNSKSTILNDTTLSSMPSVSAFMQALTVDALSIPLSGIMIARGRRSLFSFSLRIAQTLYLACMLQFGASLAENIAIQIETSLNGTPRFATPPRPNLTEQIGSVVVFVFGAAVITRARYRIIPATLIIVAVGAPVHHAVIAFDEFGLMNVFKACLGSLLSDLLCQIFVVSSAPAKLSMVSLLLVTGFTRLERTRYTMVSPQFNISEIMWVSIHIVLGLWLAKMFSRTFKFKIA
ncbi:DUF1212 domain membrane protein Prm10 [Penicillium riverlandense]|uniref:DUF1212 domain membrane protein Prm10 n=1 Tax=Penicillium riverlandense TaxID=1903569 RepID=UPI002547B61B|nr:DUF1212 domain membrane protein Prm10 [Penicillium riverlandense]KAJ5807962.1 DUF1212 domain membrane protein Prm10 [Penicillium riverlandense]